MSHIHYVILYHGKAREAGRFPRFFGLSSIRASVRLRAVSVFGPGDFYILAYRIAEEVGGKTYGRWIVQGVCFDFPFYVLEQRGIPCGKDLYYQMRRKFYYELSMRI